MAMQSGRKAAGRGRWAAIGAVAVLVAAIGSTPLLAGCISADLPAPVRVPSGKGFAEGRISLCDVRTLSPVSSLYRFEVDGRPIGMLVTRHGTNESSSDQQPAIVFSRDGDGRLTLAGFATPEGSRMATHFVTPPVTAGGRRAEFARSAPPVVVDVAPLLVVRAGRGAGSD